MSLMSTTAAFTGLDALRNLVSDSMAIDMGSEATIIVVRGRGVVVDEPSLVAVSTTTGEVIAIGLEAQQMYGDRKSTRLNSSHITISYAVFCLKKKKKKTKKLRIKREERPWNNKSVGQGTAACW